MIAIASAVAFTPRVRASAGSNGRVARAIAPQKIRIGATERRTSVVAASGKGFFSEPTNDGATLFRFYDENDAAAKAAAKAAHEAATGKKDEPEGYEVSGERNVRLFGQERLHFATQR